MWCVWWVWGGKEKEKEMLCISGLIPLGTVTVTPFCSAARLEALVLWRLCHSCGVAGVRPCRQVFSLLTLLYICWCTYLCIFRIKLFGLLELCGNKCVTGLGFLFQIGHAHYVPPTVAPCSCRCTQLLA